MAGTVGPMGAAAYTYNLLGNRTSRDKYGLVDTHVYTPGTNRLERIEGPEDAQTDLTYDARGNTTALGDMTLTYNQENRLAQVDGDGVATSYVYNGMGQRVIKTTGEGVTFLPIGLKPVTIEIEVPPSTVNGQKHVKAFMDNLLFILLC